MTNHPYVQPKPTDGPTVCAVCGKSAQDECHYPPYEPDSDAGKAMQKVNKAVDWMLERNLRALDR